MAAGKVAVGPQVRVADQLEKRPQPHGLVAVDAHGRDLDLARGVAMVVAVDLGVEDQGPLRDVANPQLERSVDLAGGLAGDLFGRRTPGRALERAVDLVTAAGTIARSARPQ